MKNQLHALALCIAFFAGVSLSAQVSIGIRTGANWNNVDVSGGLDALTPDFKTVSGMNIGVVMEFPIGANFSIQPELAYMKKGFGVKEDFGIDLFEIPFPIGVRTDSRFGYLEMPVLAKYKFGNNTVQAYVAAGPTIGYALNGRLITRTKFLVDFKVLDLPINLDAIDYQRVEVGATAGAGLVFNLGGAQLFMDARYTHGFSQIYDLPIVENRVSNRGFGVNAGVMFPIGQ
jgi:hypothetical protein